MTNKFISMGTLLCMLTVLLIGRISPADPLFSFISLDPAATLMRLVLVIAMVAVTFASFKSSFGRRLLASAGVLLISLGAASFLFTPVYDLLYDYMMPLDVLFIIESGIVFSAVAFDKQIKPKHRGTEGIKIPVSVAA